MIELQHCHLGLPDVKQRATLFVMRDQTLTSAGAAVRILRTKAGLTLMEVAEGADTAVAYLSKVERGHLNPTDDYIARVIGFIATQMLRLAHEH